MTLGLPPPGRRHRAQWLGLALGTLALHLIGLTRYGWFRDEFYYVACARRLTWGYVDHPPLSIAVLALVRGVAGESLFAIRLTAAVAGAATVYFTARLAREMGGGAFAQALAGLAALLAPIFLGITRFYSMNAFDVLIWTLASLALIGALREGGARRWSMLGLWMGLGLLNKISMMWFGIGLLAGLVWTSHRRHLLTPWPYLAAAVAVLCFLPHVLWQAANQWPTREFMRNATAYKMATVSVRDFLLTQFRVLGAGNALIYVPGLLYGLLAAGGAPWRIFSILFLTVATLLIAAGTSRANYLAVAYPPLFALGGLAWERWSARAPRLARGALVAVVILLGLPWIPLALPVLPVEDFIRYQAALGMQPKSEERKEVGPLPQHYADEHGWNELASEVAKALARLTPEERAKAVVFGQNYGEAGAIDVLGRKLGLPRAISGHNNYWLWGPGDWDGSVIIIIGGDRPDNAAFFESVEVVGTWDHPYAMPYERHLDISIGRRLKKTPKEVWPQLRHYN
ncbi:MAG TPA: glycosyltransferase family 39 protein [Candidatus Eisenbacteria bacterium]|nr:glycosyltransferase family 39 protein [Candidatus Eisenbacteria bacterium]